jgi:hypothetical protein
VWLARSGDEGRTFAREVAAGGETTGACGCCGMRAFADAAGELFLLYRAAREGVHRDMTLLASKSGAGPFRTIPVAEWELKACPMSTAWISQAGSGVVLAWETAGQVFYSRLDSATGSLSPPVSPPGETGKRRHPAAAVNERGSTLLVWSEGTGWNRGGSIAFQLFGADGRPAVTSGYSNAGLLPVWSLPAAAVAPNGDFFVLF